MGEEMKIPLELFSLSLSPSQHLPSLGKIHPLGYLLLHVSDLQKDEAINKDSQNMLTSFLFLKITK